ncbi:hypothetical protein ACHQM5_022934 [Ranunculus cassubicifolius]
MRSLKSEAQNLTKQIDSWAESDMIRSRKRKYHQIFEKKNRDQIVESNGADSEMESESVEKRGNISEEIGEKSTENIVVFMDEDYRVFLELIGAFLTGDLVHERERREENVGVVSENLAANVGDREENLGVLLEDCSPKEVVVVENEELNEAILPVVDCPDPHYEIFLNNVREDGEFYVFEKEREDGTIETIRYEREDEDVGEFMDVEVAEPVAVAMNLVEGVEVTERRGKGIEKEGVNRSKDNSVQERSEDVSVTMKIKEEPLDGDLGISGGCRSRKIDLRTSFMFLSRCRPEMTIHADDGYLAYLGHVRVKGNSLIYEHGNAIVIYDEDITVVPDLEVPVKKLEIHGNQKKFTRPHSTLEVNRTLVSNIEDIAVVPDLEVPEKKPDIHSNQMKFTPHSTLEANRTLINEDDSDAVEILTGSLKVDSKGVLRKKLQKILEKPFDKKEFKEKFKAARIRKLMEKNRVMRGRDVTYQTDELSPSYLDLHPDLWIMLKSVLNEKPEPKRALSLLRCLFFYYENVSHPGSFFPWKNPPSWLHNKICSCPDYLNCYKKISMSPGKRRPSY